MLVIENTDIIVRNIDVTCTLKINIVSFLKEKIVYNVGYDIKITSYFKIILLLSSLLVMLATYL